MKKVFLSQPKNNNTEAENIALKTKLDYIVKSVCANDDVIIVGGQTDKFDKEEGTRKSLFLLAHALETLANCDMLCITEGWEKDSDCKILYTAAVEYGLTVKHI